MARQRWDRFISRFNRLKFEVKVGLIVTLVGSIVVASLTGCFTIVSAIIMRPLEVPTEFPVVQDVKKLEAEIKLTEFNENSTHTAIAKFYTVTPTPTSTPTSTWTPDLTKTLGVQLTQNFQLTAEIPTNTAAPTYTIIPTGTETPLPSYTPTIDLTSQLAITLTQSAIGTQNYQNAASTYDARVTQTFEALELTVTKTPTPTATIDRNATAVIRSTLQQTPTVSVYGYTKSDVNIRATPEVNQNNIITTVASGSQVILLSQFQEQGKYDYSWYYAMLSGGQLGWIRNDFVMFLGKPTQQPNPNYQQVLAHLPVVNNAQWLPYSKQFDGVEMVLVPPGCYTMGVVNQTTGVEGSDVCVEAPFWIDKFEVTNKQFRDFKGKALDPSRIKGDSQPVDMVSWIEANSFCRDSRLARLPTDLEWEYVARGPSNQLYPWIEPTLITTNLVFSPDKDNRLTTSAPVGSKPDGMSWVGALDMSGNLFEWVSTIYDPDRFPYPYRNDGREDEKDYVSRRVHRGGAYYNYEIHYMQTIYSDGKLPDTHDPYIGFRCAKDFQDGDLP